jgi:hypothetical protein
VEVYPFSLPEGRIPERSGLIRRIFAEVSVRQEEKVNGIKEG